MRMDPPVSHSGKLWETAEGGGVIAMISATSNVSMGFAVIGAGVSLYYLCQMLSYAFFRLPISMYLMRTVTFLYATICTFARIFWTWCRWPMCVVKAYLVTLLRTWSPERMLLRLQALLHSVIYVILFFDDAKQVVLARWPMVEDILQPRSYIPAPFILKACAVGVLTLLHVVMSFLLIGLWNLLLKILERSLVGVEITRRRRA